NSSAGTIKLDPTLSKLGTGKLELEIKSDPPAPPAATQGDKNDKQAKTVSTPKDGRIFFVRQKGVGQAAFAMGNPDNKEETALQEAGFHAVSPDGQKVAYGVAVHEENSDKDEVFLKTVGDEKPGESLKVQGSCWCWSPDGRALAITTLQGNALSHEIFDLKTK